MIDALDALGRRYGQPPSYWLEKDDVLTAFDYEVMGRSRAKES